MIFSFHTLEISGNGAKAYNCISCGGLITYSDRLIRIGGSTRHFFVNPAGVECDFHSFSSCPGAMVFGEPTLEHTWFPGYTWAMAVCRRCSQHLGWHYQAVSAAEPPGNFWGILVSFLIAR